MTFMEHFMNEVSCYHEHFMYDIYLVKIQCSQGADLADIGI